MNEMKVKIVFWYLINVLIGVFIIGSLFGVGAIIRSSNAVTPSRTITVSGEGKVNMKPDLATASFAVVSQGEKPELIAQENTEKINRAIAFLEEKGIEDKDIKTTDYNLYPRYKWDEKTNDNKIIGYEIRQTVSVKIRDIEKAGEIIGGLTSVGINEIHSLNFTVEDPIAQENEARLDAFTEAREKADAMARANGVIIARVINFSESNGGYPIPYYSRSFDLGKGGMTEGAVAPDIQPGEQEITITVSVTYEIR